MGSVGQVGEKRAKGEIAKLKGAGAERNWEKFLQHCTIFHNRRAKRHTKEDRKGWGQELGFQGMGSGKFRTPLPPLHN